MLEGYNIRLGTKEECASLLEKHHYLSVMKLSHGFKVGKNYVLVSPKEDVVGCCIFTAWPVPELAVGCFGLRRDQQDGLYELSRLVLHPSMQEEKGVASWFVSRALKLLRKNEGARAVLSYADADHHRGTVYRALNFGYYGLSDLKKDFFRKEADGTFKKVSRGRVAGMEGEWRPRSRKHRFLIVYDKKLAPRWQKQ